MFSNLFYASRAIQSPGESRPSCNIELCCSSQNSKEGVWIWCTLDIVNEVLHIQTSFVHKLELDDFREFLILFEGRQFLLFEDLLVHYLRIELNLMYKNIWDPGIGCQFGVNYRDIINLFIRTVEMTKMTYGDDKHKAFVANKSTSHEQLFIVWDLRGDICGKIRRRYMPEDYRLMWMQGKIKREHLLSSRRHF